MKKATVLLLVILSIKVNSQTASKTVSEKMELAQQYLTGYNQPLNPSKALTIFKECADSGNSKAMNAVGLHYRLGLGVTTNYKEAINWFQRSANNGYSTAWYNLGLMYKHGSGTSMNYEKAYQCFEKASNLENPIGWYSQAYMLYKGLGCKQDYVKAAQLFKKGAVMGKPSCMYFLGLSFRNGYGVVTNIDSAKFWLNRASKSGYQQATDELSSHDPENVAVVGNLIKNAAAAEKMGEALHKPVGQYTKVPHGLPIAEINGEYEGFLIKYDYSGKHLVQVSKLNVQLMCTEIGQIEGQWKEDDSLIVPLKALLTKNGLTFNGMEYMKADHYSYENKRLYNFDKATLSFSKSADSVFLSGNVTMFRPERQEPEKPLQLVLLRTKKMDGKGEIVFTDNNIKLLTAYPNPFTGIINIQFNLTQSCKVYTQILTIDGKVVYTQPETILEKGNYVLPLQPNITAGTYVIKLVYGDKIATVKAIKQ